MKRDFVTIRKQLIFNHIIILILTLVFTYVFVLQAVFNMIVSNLVSVSQQAMITSSNNLESTLDYAASHILQVVTNETVQDELRMLKDSSMNNLLYHENNAYEKSPTRARFERYINTNLITLQNIPFLTEITFLDNNGNYKPIYFSNRQNQITPEYYLRNDPWIEDLVDKDGKFLWSSYVDMSNSYLRLSKIIYDVNDYSQTLGTMSLDFSYDHLVDIINQLKNQFGITAALVDTKTGNEIGYRTTGVEINKDMDFTDSYFILPSNKEYFFINNIKGTTFALVGIKSLEEAQMILYNSSIILLIVACIALVLDIILAFLLSHRISKPIVALAQTMKNVEVGNLDVSVQIEQKNEIGELYHSFNNMIKIINQLIEENYVAVINTKQIELSALQSQINTHFLYNTLDSINWLARDYKADDISYLVTNLATLLRTSLNNGNPELTVEKEIEHVRSYINIQQKRFAGRFMVEWDIDNSLLNDCLIKMLLQPLAENAILHAFNEAGSNMTENFLKISIMNDDECLVLSVGNTANPEDLDVIYEILESDIEDHSLASYGIVSIKRRLQIAYNEQATYTYSFDEVGMLYATITIPRSYTAINRTDVPRTVNL